MTQLEQPWQENVSVTQICILNIFFVNELNKHKWVTLVFITHLLIQQIFIKHLSWSIKGDKCLNSKIHKLVLALNKNTIQLLSLPLTVYLNTLKLET